jgi:hypothetical protein
MLLFLLACAPDAAPPLCPSYSGFSEVGQSWTWRTFADDTETTATLTALDTSAVVLESDSWTEHYRCDDDGLWATLRTASTDDLDARWEYDPAYLVMPATVGVGDAWTQAGAWFYSDSSGARGTASHNEQIEVVGEGESNVAAGAFTTLELHRLGEDATTATEYVAAGVGRVLDDEAQLIRTE